MVTAGMTGTGRPLTQTGAFSLIGAARQSFREVRGLRWFVARGLMLNYAMFAVMAALMVGLVYTQIVAPYADQLRELFQGGGFWMNLLAGLMTVIFWITGLLLLAATFLIAAILSLAMMSLWFESLAGRIVTHWRPDVSGPEFRLGAWLAGLGRAIGDSLGLLLLSVLALVLGFIPLAGPVLVVIINSYLLGREVRDPYLTVARDLEAPESAAIPRGFKFQIWTLRLGVVPVILAAVPIAGWILMPATLIYLVAGVAWSGERERAGAAATGGSPETET